jgi:hypothetical protein
MFDPAQILLFIIIIVLTIFLVVLGIQVSLILKDLRVTIRKANKVLDDTGEITEAVKVPITGLSSAVTGFKAGSSLLGIFNRVSSQKKEEKHGK